MRNERDRESETERERGERERERERQRGREEREREKMGDDEKMNEKQEKGRVGRREIKTRRCI